MCSSRSPTMIGCRLRQRRSVTNTKLPTGNADEHDRREDQRQRETTTGRSRAGEASDHRDRRAGEEEPERHRAGVAHEDLRRDRSCTEGIRCMRRASAAATSGASGSGPRNCCGQSRRVQEQPAAGDRRQTGRESVEAVDVVDGVRQQDDPEDRRDRRRCPATTRDRRRSPGSQKKLICTPDRKRIPPAKICPASFAGGDRSRWSSAMPRHEHDEPADEQTERLAETERVAERRRSASRRRTRRRPRRRSRCPPNVGVGARWILRSTGTSSHPRRTTTARTSGVHDDSEPQRRRRRRARYGRHTRRHG